MRVNKLYSKRISHNIVFIASLNDRVIGGIYLLYLSTLSVPTIQAILVLPFVPCRRVEEGHKVPSRCGWIVDRYNVRIVRPAAIREGDGITLHRDGHIPKLTCVATQMRTIVNH